MILASLIFAFPAAALHVSTGRKYLRGAVLQGTTPLPAVVPVPAAVAV